MGDKDKANKPLTEQQKIRADRAAGVITNNTSRSGTASPSEKAIVVAGQNSKGKSVKSLLPGGALPVLSNEVDPITGKYITSPTPLFPAGSQYTELQRLTPKDRAKLQRDMYSLGLYPENYTPTFGFLGLAGEDATAITKLMVVGEQKGIGDINEVIKLAKKDKEVKNLLLGTGYAKKGPALTDVATAASNLNSYFLDMFNEKPSKTDLKEYHSAINAAERASKGSIGTQQSEDILLSVATKKANELIAAAKLGDPKAQTKLESGQLGKTVRAIRNAYADNGLPIDDSKIYAKAVKAARSNTAYDNVIQGIRLNAKTQWAPFADYIDQGQSVKDLVDPYITIRSKVTGIPKEQINISDMTDVVDSDGKLKPVSKYKSEIYQSDEYLQSSNFQQQKLNDIQTVLRNFGIG